MQESACVTGMLDMLEGGKEVMGIGGKCPQDEKCRRANVGLSRGRLFLFLVEVGENEEKRRKETKKKHRDFVFCCWLTLRCA